MIAPLERLTLPAHLDGSMLARGGPPAGVGIEARNDLEAIQIWLVEVTNSQASLRSYRLEAERCLLWATNERGKPLAALNAEDIRAYARFMLDPQPRDLWLSDRNARREDDAWRPFRGPLSPRSTERAIGIISSLFEWLESGGYLSENPWHSAALKPRSVDKKNLAPAKLLEGRASVATMVEWSYIRKALDELDAIDEGYASLRTRLILYLAYFADMKPSEISSLRTSAIHIFRASPTPVWQLAIEGRPPEIRDIILLPPAQEILERYLASRGISVGANALTADGPVMVSSRDTQDCSENEVNLSRHTVHSSTRGVFLRAAEQAKSVGDKAAAARLSRATVHWLRHAFEVHTIQMDTPKNWCWYLLGAYWLAAPLFRSYLPDRTPFSTEIALQAFIDLRDMWQGSTNDVGA